jgi:hypothetical protein
MSSKYTHEIFLNATQDIDTLLASEHNRIIEITHILANCILLASGNNKLETKHHKNLESISAFVIYHSFLLQSIINAQVILMNLENNLEGIVNTEINQFIKSHHTINAEIYQLLREKCFHIEKKEILVYANLISNLIKTKKHRENNFMLGVIQAADFIRKTIVPKLNNKYCFLYI